MSQASVHLCIDISDPWFGLRVKLVWIEPLPQGAHKVEVLDPLHSGFNQSALFRKIQKHPNGYLLGHFSRIAVEKYFFQSGISHLDLLDFRNMQPSERRLVASRYIGMVYDSLRYLQESNTHNLSYWISGIGKTKEEKQKLFKLKVFPSPVSIQLQAVQRSSEIEFKFYYSFESSTYVEPDLQFWGKLLIHNSTLYLAQNPKLFNEFYQRHPTGKGIISQKDFPNYYVDFLASFLRKYHLSIPLGLEKEVEIITPECQVHVKEYMQDFLMLTPQYRYGAQVLEYNDDKTLKPDSSVGHAAILLRDLDFEKAFYDKVQALHTSFKSQLSNSFFYLPFKEVLKNQWFVKATRQLNEEGVTVTGVEDLKTFKLDRLHPSLDVQLTLGNNCVEMRPVVQWGNQEASLRNLRSAILANQRFVPLPDGTLGILPDAWVEDYGVFFRIGSFESNHIRLSLLHLQLFKGKSVMQSFPKPILEKMEQVEAHLQEAHTLLTPIPASIQATLRDYQAEGFRWMIRLHTLGWGGCLADDMGLGKTLQTITFLQYLIDSGSTKPHLVVCPVSLIFNWETELRKFAPTISFITYTSQQRDLHPPDTPHYQVVISSYGMVRSDIELFAAIEWGYIVLDESHTIKNPAAATTMALMELQSDNKLILSGTPLQNNTFDLYSQFSFVNPGLLGTREQFKQYFALEIDKNGNQSRSLQLRSILEPFILRRTKEQVAKDLPARSEIVLWCEMTEPQRAIYDLMRKDYRKTLAQKFSEEGIEKSSMHIMEALLRLRQICDDPRLVPTHKQSDSTGVKIDTLISEIEENGSNHKVLVFSQFVEMLHLIRARLEQDRIEFAYLDGSTPQEDRQKQVQLFQEDAQVRVFLISLKAGGVGLNLTQADYVYLVDPWWNPAAEQQAIDRAHRIGQTKPVFAYKMICKNSVEEKIMLLQEKKSKLAKDLISSEPSFFKSLSAEDIDYLLS